MHATIQKPIEEIVGYLEPDERVFVVGCGNCAAKCHSGGEPGRLGLHARWCQPLQTVHHAEDAQ